MPRPTSKDALLEAMHAERHKLDALLNTLPADRMTEPGVCEQWSVKDILAHLYAWQQMVMAWYGAGKRGESVKTPAPDLGWSETPALNQRIYEQYRDTPLSDIQAKFAASYDEIRALISAIPEDDLITPKVYAWTKTSTLLSYFVSCTSSHDHWAYDEIRRWKKAQGV